MGKYKAQWDYASSYGAVNEGEVVEFEDELAEAINRDSPGVLKPVGGKSSDAQSGDPADAPPADRMTKKAPRRRSTKGSEGDGSGGEITRSELGAVKDEEA